MAEPLDYQTPAARPPDRGIETLAVTITIVHLAATIITVVIGFPLAMSDFDRPGAPGAPVGDALMLVHRILRMPLGLVPVPGLGGWLVFFTNSMIWGIVIAHGVRFVRRRTRRA